MIKGLVVVVFGILVLLLGEAILLRMKKCKDEAWGKVVGFQGYKGNIKWSLFTTLNLTIEYKYNGKEMKANTLNAITCLTSNIDKILAKKSYAVGDRLLVKVNADKPEDICTEYKRNAAIVIGGFLIIAFGLIMIVMGY